MYVSTYIIRRRLDRGIGVVISMPRKEWVNRGSERSAHQRLDIPLQCAPGQLQGWPRITGSASSTAQHSKHNAHLLSPQGCSHLLGQFQA